jgi:hypothetical protein
MSSKYEERADLTDNDELTESWETGPDSPTGIAPETRTALSKRALARRRIEEHFEKKRLQELIGDDFLYDDYLID